MTTISRTWLPAAGKDDRAGAPGVAPGADRAWQLAMEKAQTRQWFHGAIGQGPAAQRDVPAQLPARNGAPSPAARSQAFQPDAAVVPMDVAQQEPGGCAHAASRPRSGVAVPAPNAGAARAVATTSDVLAWRSALQARLGVQPVIQRAVAAYHAEATARADIDPAAAAPAAPVRVHVEDGPEGLRVWFGLAGEGPAMAARARILLAELRRECDSAGQRLALVVCNGETLFEMPADGDLPQPRPVFPHPQEP